MSMKTRTAQRGGKPWTSPHDPKPTIPAPPMSASERELAVQTMLLIAVTLAADELHAGHVRDLSAYQMCGLWQALEDALNAWRAGK